MDCRAAMSMARLWRDQGKREEARDLLSPVYGWFTEGFDTPYICDVGPTCPLVGLRGLGSGALTPVGPLFFSPIQKLLLFSIR
jgi:hypothetical protein